MDRKPRSSTFVQRRIADDGPGSLQHPKPNVIRILVAGKIDRGNVAFPNTSLLLNLVNLHAGKFWKIWPAVLFYTVFATGGRSVLPPRFSA